MQNMFVAFPPPSKISWCTSEHQAFLDKFFTITTFYPIQMDIERIPDITTLYLYVLFTFTFYFKINLNFTFNYHYA